MSSYLPPEYSKYFQQLQLIEKRRLRILDSVAAHFGREQTHENLRKHPKTHIPLTEDLFLKIENFDFFSSDSILDFSHEVL